MDGYREEGSSSQDRQSNPTVHEVGEGSSQAEEGFPHAACESPSSSTLLDINSAMDRMPPQGDASPTSGPHTGGSLIIAAKCRTSFNRILQFVAETNIAVDALSKALHVFTAAESASTCTVEGMSALKKVLDFSFHDVESFVRLVRIALEAMGH
ncbi:hypothetical protein L7F22_014358 [Adiantum nelumboides]|nr:hypothetical protein [Adiantum nelumboides]